jgi:cation diffusion facilitator CzcD-associated flavoprotein CzcO
MNPKVCIIGAGSSGIVACKVLKQHGIDFDCYEKGSGIGGNWRYMNDNGMSAAYRSLHINTSKKVMAYSDYPMPESYPDYPSHFQILEYFESYVNHFGFRDKIQFGVGVTNVQKLENNTYQVSLDNGKTLLYDAVIVASGHHWKPRYPDFEGTFEGKTLHAHDYKTPDIFQNDPNVLVVGIGNSGVDIACEAARNTTGKVWISTRSGAYILPKYIMGIPFDTLNKYSVDWLPMAVKRALLSFFLWLARGKQQNYGVPKPKRPLLSEHPTISQDLLSLAGHGKVLFKPNIKKLNGKSVIFEDGSEETIDILIYATGYKIAFPFFDKDFLYVETDNRLELYKNVILPNVPHLYFIGFLQPLGAIMPLAEVQSEWVAQLIMGKAQLPSPEKMKADIAAEKSKMQKRYKSSPRHTIQVDFYPYKNMILREIKKSR